MANQSSLCTEWDSNRKMGLHWYSESLWDYMYTHNGLCFLSQRHDSALRLTYRWKVWYIVSISVQSGSLIWQLYNGSENFENKKLRDYRNARWICLETMILSIYQEFYKGYQSYCRNYFLRLGYSHYEHSTLVPEIQYVIRT